MSLVRVINICSIMAAVDEYYTTTINNNIMADLPFNNINIQPYSPFDLSDYSMMLDEGPVLDYSNSSPDHHHQQLLTIPEVGSQQSASFVDTSSRSSSCTRVAFRTKSEVDIMDDGFRWRKYGQKSVKNSPNPRNYYRCSTEGCSVKKRVERDPQVPSYVITTYEGIHNHTSSDVVYYATQDTHSGRFVVSGFHHIDQS